MRKTVVLAILLSTGSFTIVHPQGKNSTPYSSIAPTEQYLIAEKQDEISLARSAAPPSISSDTDVLVLGKQGYEIASRVKMASCALLSVPGLRVSMMLNFGIPK